MGKMAAPASPKESFALQHITFLWILGFIDLVAIEGQSLSAGRIFHPPYLCCEISVGRSMQLHQRLHMHLFVSLCRRLCKRVFVDAVLCLHCILSLVLEVQGTVEMKSCSETLGPARKSPNISGALGDTGSAPDILYL